VLLNDACHALPSVVRHHTSAPARVHRTGRWGGPRSGSLSDMGTIRWGIIGAGWIADIMAADFAFVPGADLVAIASRDHSRARELADKHGVPRAYGSYGELLADDDIDVVYIATTHPHHRDVALAAIDAGKGLLVEKAFTATL